MRILVISDSHGRTGEVEKAVEAQPTAKHVFFLGDTLRDVDALEYIYPDRIFHTIAGNCDFGSDAPTQGLLRVGGKNIFYTHGHGFGVKGSTGPLLSYGRARGADIILYGHTHIANTEYADGVFLVNPGSIGRSRNGACSYAVIDIKKGGVMPIIINT